MKLMTMVESEKASFLLNHKDRILLIGSCFTNEIGDKFDEHGFTTCKNPFGILYNPLSISVCLDHIINNVYLTEKDLVYSNEYYYAFSCHGDYRGRTKEECLQKINNSIKHSHDFIKQATCIILTFGSMWSYWYKPNNYLMGNCHKINDKYIDRRLLSYDEVIKNLLGNVQQIKNKFNENIKFIFTLSPIRHWREGYHDNMLSKSYLYILINDLVNLIGTNAFYFPSYEIVMDELRDYRFYKEDLLHVSNLTVDYIWEKFSDSVFAKEEIAKNKEYKKLFLMKSHRPLEPQSEGYKQHLKKIAELEAKLNDRT